jgi:hypothetical protein
LDNELNLKGQYVADNPVIRDIACSSDGKYVVAVGFSGISDDELSRVYFFEMESIVDSGMVQLTPIIVGIIVIVVAGFVGFVVYRRISRKE